MLLHRLSFFVCKVGIDNMFLKYLKISIFIFLQFLLLVGHLVIFRELVFYTIGYENMINSSAFPDRIELAMLNLNVYYFVLFFILSMLLNMDVFSIKYKK